MGYFNCWCMRWPRLRRLVVRPLVAAVFVGVVSPAWADFRYSGYKWGSPTLGTAATVTWSVVPPGSYYQDFNATFPSGYLDEFRAAFDAWSQVANISFVEVPDAGSVGADIRLHLDPDDGPGGPLAYAYYPTGSASAGDVHFDAGTNWFIDSDGTGFELFGDVFQVAVHEIGHSIGLQHSVGVPATLGARNSGYRGLLPSDIAGAQFIYGPASGWVAPPASNVVLELTDASSLQITFRALDDQLILSDSAPLTGEIEAFLGHSAPGVVSTFGIRDSQLETLAGMDFEYEDLPLLFVDGHTFDLNAALVSTIDHAVGSGGVFDPLGAVLGLTDGTFDFEAGSPLFGFGGARLFDFFVEPLSLPVLAGGSPASIVKTPGATPGQWDVHLQMPVHVESAVDFSIFLDDLPPGLLIVDIVVDAMIDARGTYSVVPEPPLVVPALAMFALIGAVAGLRRETGEKTRS